MEQIIILIVIGLLSTIFGKKNKGDDQTRKQGTPQNTEPPNRPSSGRQSMPQRTEASQTRQGSSSGQMDPFKRLKELTGEIYKEIQEDQRKSVTQQTTPIEPVSIPEEPVKKLVNTKPVRAERQANTRSSGRLSTHNPDQHRFVKSESLNVDVTSKQDILRGVVFSEILGPPKSKQ